MVSHSASWSLDGVAVNTVIIGGGTKLLVPKVVERFVYLYCSLA